MLKFLGTLTAGCALGAIVTVCFMVGPVRTAHGVGVSAVGALIMLGIMGGVEAGKWAVRKIRG